MSEIKAGDFVKVTGGPAFVQGQPIKGNVQEVRGDVADVLVPSGGVWSFHTHHLSVLPKRSK